jgi:hypothetical protein
MARLLLDDWITQSKQYGQPTARWTNNDRTQYGQPTARWMNNDSVGLIDIIICRLAKSSLLVSYVCQTIYKINHLFQNGLVLLKCRSFLLLQLVIPTLKSLHAARTTHNTYVPLWTTISRRSDNFSPVCCVPVFRVCWVVCCSAAPSTTSSPHREFAPHFRVIFRKFDRFRRLLYHRSLRFCCCCCCCSIRSNICFLHSRVTTF